MPMTFFLCRHSLVCSGRTGLGRFADPYFARLSKPVVSGSTGGCLVSSSKRNAEVRSPNVAAPFGDIRFPNAGEFFQKLKH